MIRGLLDTKVLVSGLVRRHPQAPSVQVLDSWRAGIFELLLSGEIFAEVARTLAKPYFRARLTDDQVERALLLLSTDATWTPLTLQVHGVATHPEDDLVLSAGLSGHAGYLVTGDAQLLKIEVYESIQILSPADFLILLPD